MTAARRRRRRPEKAAARAPDDPRPSASPIPLPPNAIALAILALCAGYYAWCALSLLRHDPPAWPDEALFADPARALLREGRLGTPLLTGYLPGIEARTYWVPPLYLVALAPVFAVFGATLGVMRGLSVATGLAALALTHRAARRVGLGPLAAALPVALLAVDGVFLRAARLGRMDLLALTLALAAAVAATSPTDRNGASIPLWRRAMFRAGLLAGLAAATHPMGAAGLVAVGVAALRGGAPALRDAGLGAVGPLGLWGLYVAADPAGFAAQFGAQLARKAGRDPWSWRFLSRSYEMNLGQYAGASRGDADPRPAVQLAWALGTAGLGALAWRARGTLPLLALHLALAALALVSLEMWYPVYVAPTTALGVAALLAAPGAWRTWTTGAALLASAWFAERNATREAALRARWEAAGEAARYEPFCEAVSARIPLGARVFVSLFPDLSLCLARRADLTLRTFVPDGLAVPPAAQAEVLRGADYVVTGRDAPGTLADATAPRVGALVAEVGAPRPGAYHARVYRMPGASR